MFRFLIPLKTTIYYDLNINSHGPIPSSMFSHGLCCFIFWFNVFLMTVCENKASRSLNFNTNKPCRTYRDVWILPVVFRHCVILPSFSASRPCFTPRCSVNTIDKNWQTGSRVFNLLQRMELNYCYFAEVIHHLPQLLFFFTTENLMSVYLICLIENE